VSASVLVASVVAPLDSHLFKWFSGGEGKGLVEEVDVREDEW
jgi:hypothetical protein